jgi:hypothetical protein
VKAASPAPGKFRWSTAVEFLDGTMIYGADARDIMERWGRLLGWAAGHALSSDDVKITALGFARGFYGAELDDGVVDLDDLDFLRSLSAAKVIYLIER